MAQIAPPVAGEADHRAAALERPTGYSGRGGLTIAFIISPGRAGAIAMAT
jgi:hypothetical protein